MGWQKTLNGYVMRAVVVGQKKIALISTSIPCTKITSMSVQLANNGSNSSQTCKNMMNLLIAQKLFGNQKIKQFQMYNRRLGDGRCQFNFRGIILPCFESHLTVYVVLAEKTLMKHLEKLVQVFQGILKSNATKLFERLPKGGAGIVAAATGIDGQIKVYDRDKGVICYIINTAECCHKMSDELAENVYKIIDSQLTDAVDMSEVQDEFSAVIPKALVTLLHGLETKFDAEMDAMTWVPWGSLASVGEQSEYVNGINVILTSSIPVLGSLLYPLYFQFFLDKLASCLGPHFYLNIFSCKQISGTGAQQMLDTQALKTILLEIPSLAKQTSGAAINSKFVSREMSKAEASLKVILSLVDSEVDTYRALLPEGTPLEFHCILELKGLKKAVEQNYDLGQESLTHNILPHRLSQLSLASLHLLPSSVQPLDPGIIASREDVLTRAAALGI